MAWLPLTRPGWEFDNAPADPGPSNPKKQALWAKQTNGIRTNPNGIQIYTHCRRIGTTGNTSELNKTYWDAQ